MPLNLLIADDSTTIHKVISLAFEDENVTVLTAGNGQEALDKANDAQPDIIFADTEMPELNGFELCQKIRENEKLKKIPVCLIHSDFEELDEEKYRVCGADTHLPKPFKSEDIVNKVAEITGGAGKEKKDETKLTDDLSKKENMESEEKPQDKSDLLEVLPLDEVEKEIQGSEAFELKLENIISEPAENNEAVLKNVSEQEPSEDVLADFMESLKTDDGIEKELDEAEPCTEKDKPEVSKKPDYVEIYELELTGDEIKEEKEDLIEDARMLPDSIIETPETKKTVINKPPKSEEHLSVDDFERLIGGHIKKVIENILKEAVQNEVAAITDKIIEAVEKIAREITPDISKTIIQKEIEKIKNPEA
ncbi:MAG: response regulator [Nitrospinota bacterium]|jgi:CheY-like chemotaxis protein|nr:response regulator [Nitrospinota bacterium]MDP7580788.1 response regulator [Nitrospinota bacterium]HJN03342.1 response regulator [Nitrospinota bacterium]